MKKYGLVFIVVILMAACKTASIPEAYIFKAKEIQNIPFGCWSTFTCKKQAAPNSISEGELLCIQGNTVYLLIADSTVIEIPCETILNAKLYTHQNQANKYLLTTGLFLLPNIIGAIAYAGNDDGYSGAFLALGIPVTITGLTMAGIENRKKSNILLFPSKHSLSQFNAFARYPGGIPPHLNYKHLYLRNY